MELIRILLVDDTPNELDRYLRALKKHVATKNINLEIEIKLNSSEALNHLLEKNPYDILLIDIVGVSYEELIKKVENIFPYLPIVMFSRQRIPEQIVKCIDLGAKSFIFKQDLRIGTLPIAPYDEDEDEITWSRVIDVILKLVGEYRHIKRILESSEEIGWIRKKGDRNSIIKDQISFLQFIKDDSELEEFFPSIRNSGEINEFTYYEMPLYRMKSLRHLIFEESDQENCIKISKKVLDQVLSFVFNKLYSRSFTLYNDFVETTYFEKYSTRLAQVQELITLMKVNNSSPALEAYEKLLTYNPVINGMPLLNPTKILQILKDDLEFIKLITPPFITIIHGDLHFDNILVNDRLPKKLRIKLIDPRGFQHIGYPIGIGDVAYDIGKLLHSANGYYDFIHTGYMIADMRDIKYVSNMTFEISKLKKEEWATIPHKGGGSGDILTSHKQLIQEWVWDIFFSLAEYILLWIKNMDYEKKDPNWLIRAKFNEALHFCTMGKFHIQEDVGRSISLHVRGVELINEFFNNYKVGNFQKI